jgi:bifunctional DNA-binding transcriptional regulator/antitoxin component of YhaV-PrlF toxin-antitoxin module
MSRDIYATVDRAGRIVIPIIDREVLGIVEGSRITFVISAVQKPKVD